MLSVLANSGPIDCPERRRGGDGYGRVQEGLHIGVLVVREHPRRLTQLDNAPEVHHGDPGRHVLNDTQVVGDEQVGQPKLASEMLESGPCGGHELTGTVLRTGLFAASLSGRNQHVSVGSVRAGVLFQYAFS